MNSSEIIGSIGVAILLIAFFMNLFCYLPQDGRPYALMNLVGAGLSCYASWMIHFIPFGILEATWALVAAAALFRKSSQPS